MKYINKFNNASTAINAGLLPLPQISMINNDKIYSGEKSEDYIGAHFIENDNNVKLNRVYSPLKFVSTGNSTIGFSSICSYHTIQYSYDYVNWVDVNIETVISLADKETVYIRGILSDNASPSNYTQFTMTGSIAAYGTCNSLWNYENLDAQILEGCGCNLFKDCTSLTKTPCLPSNNLNGACYYYMFRGCTNLTSAPELPATALADYCYYGMFQDCTSLTSAPVLPATTLANQCYRQMFRSCTGLTSAPELPATTLASGCYRQMFQGCTSLTSVTELPATTLAEHCYYCMFVDCANLTSATELPATTLAAQCYAGMFQGTSLTTAPELPATTLAEYCYRSMFFNCASLVNAPELPATTLANYCYCSMFNNTSIDKAPELPATTLVEGCYEGMFQYCSNLSYIKCLATSGIDTNESTYLWMLYAKSTGTFVKDPNTTWPIGDSGILSGWTIEDAA